MELNVHVLVLISVSILCLQPADCISKLGNENDRLALLEFKSQIEIGNDPNGIFSSWNDSVSFCTWQGVTCGNKHQRVMSLKLNGLSLSGTISRFVGNLSFLRYLNLGDNKFHGEIPQEVGRLFRLRYLNLVNNKFEGEIPVSISNCSELRKLGISENRLVGKIPAELSFLEKFDTLFLDSNNLTGEIPPSFGNLSSLEDFYVSFNNIGGNIPNELGKLKNLIYFTISANNLTGTVPLSFYNISSLAVFSAALNQLEGSLPANIGITLPNLQKFGIHGNFFDGTIPVSFTNASQLDILDLSDNIFTGQVPINLGDLKALQRLNLEHNFLGSNASEDLSFVISLPNCSNLKILGFDGNNFGGVLPNSIANLSTNLDQLALGSNQILGKIPVEIGNLVNLYMLGMEFNHFSGTIPISFGKLQKLQALALSGNVLSGEIPSTLGNLTQLYELYLSDNQLEGTITSSLGNCQNLHLLDVGNNELIGIIPQQIIALPSLSITLNLSQNSLMGLLPPEIGNLKSISALDVAGNNLSGEIPETIGACLSLETLHMQGNFFQGHIPSSIASLRGLQRLDLSSNNLTGNIPKELEKLLFLQYLNLSFNNLEGEVSIKGVFSNASAFSVAGNTNLCGGISEMKLPACPFKQRKHKRSPTVIILTTTVTSFLFLMMIASLLCVFYWRKSRKNPSSTPFIMDSLPQISYNELLHATGGFSSDNLIGQGGFGSVYRGILDRDGGKLVAVKVLNLQQHGASKSFIAECKALRNIRHRNLVKILTYCSSIDFKALVFDFMENGSLDTWLYQEGNGNTQVQNLNFLRRLHIAIDVSFALLYLHDDCEAPVIHCDLKPSNILLDNEMTAHVGDFGLSKLLSKTINNSSQGETSSIGIKGTIGYMAPEYGIGSEASASGDVYSLGIILLEMFTGKKPTDEMFTSGLNLHNFVKAKIPGQVMQVVDPKLELGDNNVQKCIVSILEIGLACSAEQVGERMNMRDVTRKLNIIMDAFRRGRPDSLRQTN